MSNARQPKWDWTSHWPQMEDLYRRKMSIPKIAKAIRSEGFEPSERAVYLIFTSKGYPTNQAERLKFLEGGIGASTEDLGDRIPASCIDESTQNRDLEEMAIIPSNPPSKGITGRGRQCQPNHVSSEAISSKHRPGKCRLNRMHGSGRRKIQDQDDLKVMENLRKFGLISPQKSIHRFEPHPTAAQSSYASLIPDSFKNTTNPDEPPIKRIHSFRGSRSYRDGNRLSQSTVDSGYISGRGSPHTFAPEVLSSSDPSPLEFHGLFRVACSKLHETKGQHMEISTCSLCHHSSIHNLGWSAKQFTLTEFKTKLRSQNVLGRVNDLDATGNTILFYAAVSGADIKYLLALIEVGVDPYHLNAAGHLFLHWLRPGEGDLDCFILDLVNLLNNLQWNRVFGQQDNDGQTVLHALASHIPQGKHQAQLFNYFIDAGWPPAMPDRFGKTADGSVAQTCTFGSRGIRIDSFNTATLEEQNMYIAEGPGPKSEWLLQYIGALNAHNVIAIAHNNPKYVDPDTGDTAINALSRVRTGATMSMYLDALLWQDPKRRISNHINVNMKSRDGATALHNAAVRARLDSVRSLIDAGANVNARLDNKNATSILKATFDARSEAVLANNKVLMHLFKEVISRLEYAGAVIDPSPFQERCRPELRK